MTDTPLKKRVPQRCTLKELEEAGCDRLQGFLFSKPIPFEKVGPFIQKYNETRF